MTEPNLRGGARVAALTLILIPLTALFSCRAVTDPFLGTERVLVTLPTPHPAWALAAGGEKPSYRLRWLDSDGDTREISGVSADTELELEAGVCTPIILETESERAGIPRGFLPQAGAVYPVHARKGRGPAIVEASWLRGVDAVCAELVCLRAQGGFACGQTIAAHFNWQRFDAELAKKRNPFLVDERCAADAILSGTVSVYDIKERKLYALSAPRATGGLPNGEAFIPAWTPAPGLSREEDGAFATAGDGSFAIHCPAGISRWFGKDGILTVDAENGKVICAFFTRYDLRD